jgi:hypothetical protein
VEAGVVPSAADRRWAASVLHDLVWGLDTGIPDAALRPVEGRLAQLAVELAPDDPVLGTLLDWWAAAVVGLPDSDHGHDGAGKHFPFQEVRAVPH